MGPRGKEPKDQRLKEPKRKRLNSTANRFFGSSVLRFLPCCGIMAWSGKRQVGFAQQRPSDFIETAKPLVNIARKKSATRSELSSSSTLGLFADNGERSERQRDQRLRRS